jgi:hypothetical protein
MLRDSPSSIVDEQSLYEILQVSSTASPEVIQAAYRVLARIYHPDVSTAADAERQTRRLNAAHDILSDPGRRAAYDASRALAARRSADRHSRSAPRRSPRAEPTVRHHAMDRPISASVFLWIVTATVAIAIVVAMLLMLWSLYDALDSPGSSPVAPGGRIDYSRSIPRMPPFGAPTGGPSW